MMRVVYFIASHKNPDQVIRLIKILKTGKNNSAIVINHDYSKSYLSASYFEKMNSVYILNNIEPAEWGEYSLVAMTLRALDWIVHHLKFDWVVFISGQDYPIKAIDSIENFLANTQRDGFINGVPIEKGVPCGQYECLINGNEGTPCSNCINRYNYQYYQIGSFVRPLILLKYLIHKRHIINKRQSYVKIIKLPGKKNVKFGFGPLNKLFNTKFECYKGSQWFTINKKCINYIQRFIQKNSNYLTYYKRTIIPDESFFQTILFNQSCLNIENNNKRLIIWESNEVKSPKLLSINDFPNIVSSDHHFARKFDLYNDELVMRKIDHHIFSNKAISVN